MARNRAVTVRYSRETWLHRALEVLAEQGPSRLNIENLCRALSVSRGSFYWHFEDRNDFIRQLLELWHEEYTSRPAELTESGGGTGRQKFERLVFAILDDELTRFDLPIRSWALQDPEIATLVKRTDDYRLNYIEQLFREMGYTGAELHARARTALASLTMQMNLLDTHEDIDCEEYAALICGILCQDRE